MRFRNIILSAVPLQAVTLALILICQSAMAKSAGSFIKQGFGAKAIGLGKAYGATVKDPSALYWNPAGLAQINGAKRVVKKFDPAKDAEDAFKDDSDFADPGEKKEEKKVEPAITIERSFELQLYGAYSGLVLDRQMAFTAAAFTLPYGTLGLGALGTQVTGIDGYDAAGVSTGSIKYTGGAGYLGYGFETVSDTRIGFSLMGLQEELGADKLNGGGLNVGLQKVVFPVPLVEVGLDLQNLAGVTQMSTSRTNAYDKLDTILRTSVSITSPPPNANAKLLLGFRVNLDDPQNEGFQGSIGVAVTLNRFSYLMVGFDDGQFAGGLGFLVGPVQIAYALTRDPLGIGFQHYGEFNLTF